MTPVVELITEWDAFLSKHEGATVEDFCLYYSRKVSQQKLTDELFRGVSPPDPDTIFSKLINRISAMHTAYTKMAVKELEGIELEWFWFLNAIYHRKETTKVEIINYNFFEQSTGIDILNRIKKAGFITERNNPEDKRAKLIKLTPAGEAILLKLYELVYKPTFFMFSDIPDDDKQLIVKLLANTEIKHGKILADNRTKNLDELIENAVGEENMLRMKDELKIRIQKFKSKKSM
jgi:DNA-binding MarR family transcriptional regulator